MLGLINHEYGASIRSMVAQQKLVEGVREHLETVCSTGIVNFELIADSCQQLDRAQRWVQHNRNVCMLGHLLQQAPVQGCLARAHFARQQNKSTATPYTVQQVRQRIAMAGTHEQVARIHRDGEWLFIESKKLLIHGR